MKKNHKKIFIVSFISIASTFISLFLVFYFTFLIGANVVYYRHRPVVINQTDYAFSDNLGNVYFYQSQKCYKYIKDDGNNNGCELAFSNGFNSPFVVKAISNENHIYVCYQQGNNERFFIKIFDKDLSLLKEWFFDDCQKVIDLEEKDGYLYCVVKNNSTGKFSLNSINPFGGEEKILVEDIKKTAVYRNDNTTICADVSGILVPGFCIAVSKEKTKLILNNECWFDNVCSPLFADDSIIVKYENNSYSFKNENGHLCLYKNIYLINNQLLFAAYEKVENKECGGNGRFCICSLGKTFLYSFNLLSKELILVQDYEAGAFLIDYDLDQVAYYYNGCLYLNSFSIRECETIKVGELERIKGQSFFPVGEEKKTYYLSYYNGNFYGI